MSKEKLDPSVKDKNIFERINLVMSEVDYIQKEKTRNLMYSIVSHDAVTALVRPFLVKYGVVYYPLTINRNQDFYVLKNKKGEEN